MWIIYDKFSKPGPVIIMVTELMDICSVCSEFRLSNRMIWPLKHIITQKKITAIAVVYKQFTLLQLLIRRKW
jgi:hypothetical protein